MLYVFLLFSKISRYLSAMNLKLILFSGIFRHIIKRTMNTLTSLPSVINTQNIRNFTKIGTCVIRNDGKTNQLWKMEWNKEHDELIKQNNGRIYLIVKKNEKGEDEILKIGKSECKGGMKNTFAFYQGGLGGSPSIRTFGIHHLIYNELVANNSIEIYGIWSTPVEVQVPGLFGETTELICPSIHAMEEKCRNDYKNVYGKYPPWNFQENAISWPNDILEKYKMQVQNRGNNTSSNISINNKNNETETNVLDIADIPFM